MLVAGPVIADCRVLDGLLDVGEGDRRRVVAIGQPVSAGQRVEGDSGGGLQEGCLLYTSRCV